MVAEPAELEPEKIRQQLLKMVAVPALLEPVNSKIGVVVDRRAAGRARSGELRCPERIVDEDQAAAVDDDARSRELEIEVVRERKGGRADVEGEALQRRVVRGRQIDHVEKPKNAVPIGTLVGDQLPLSLKSPEPGLGSQVASWASTVVAQRAMPAQAGRRASKTTAPACCAFRFSVQLLEALANSEP